MKINFLQAIWNYFWVIIALPIVFFYVKSRFYKWIGNSKKKHEKEIRDAKTRQNSHNDKILLCDDSVLYWKARNLFNELCKGGNITKREIFFLRNLINDLIGENILKHYKGFKFKNECHEIYIKLKCQYLEKKDFEEIILYLAECKAIERQKIREEIREVGEMNLDVIEIENTEEVLYD